MKTEMDVKLRINAVIDSLNEWVLGHDSVASQTHFGTRNF